MKVTLEQTVRTECRLCGGGFERPLSRDGLCKDCATLRLTPRQVDVLVAYATPWRVSSVTVPWDIHAWIDAAPNEQQRGMRIHATIRVIRALVDKGLMQTDGSVYVIAHADLSEMGRRLTQRLRGEG